MFDIDDIQQILSNIGLQALGFGNPSLAVHWTTVAGTTPTEGAAGTMSLQSSDHWQAPAGGILIRSGDADRIILPNGNPVSAGALVFRIHPVIFLRLQRFYATIIEGRTANTHRPERPIPYSFVYTTTDDTSSVASGEYGAGDDLGFSGTLTIHDEHGLPIDPVSVAGIFDLIIEAHGIIEDRELLSTTGTDQADRQIFDIGQLGTSQTRIHLVDVYGAPYSGSDVQNVTAVSLPDGIYTIDNPSTALSLGTGASDHLRIGPASHGTLDTTYTIRALNGGITLHRDFIRGYIVDLQPHLIGSVASGDPALDFEVRPAVRHGETVTFSLNGNAAMGVANTILSGAPDDAFIVSPAIEGDFTLPADGTDPIAQWPAFPPGTPATTGPIQASIKNNFNPVAHFIQGSDEDADVVVTLSGLTAGLAVRAYNRVFLPDAREGRGDGAGGVARVPTSSSEAKVAFTMTDPLGLKRWGSSVVLPPDPTLHLDVVVVAGNGAARVFGNVTATIGAPAALSAEETELVGSETNAFPSAEFRAISSAGLLGIEPLTTSPTGSALDVILSLTGEGNPRDSPRLPTMVRRDAMITSRSAGVFEAQLSGMHAVADSRSARHRIGSPGGKGGKAFYVVSTQTDGGRLAYDVNRAAFRRAKNVIERLVALGSDDWNLPAEATGGTVSGAILQTIASGCETPELGPFISQLSTLFSEWTTWSDVVDWLEEQLDLGNWPTFLASRISSQLTNLRTSTNAQRLFDEFKREFAACAFGRRDAYWALKHAFEQAREFVYIEGPAFTRTAYGTTVSDDLLSTLTTRMSARPGLRMIAALSKELDYGPGYETFAAREYARRQEAVAFIDALSTPEKKRIVAFHPIGFPGRPLRLMTNVVIVDDVFALIGTSNIRRRGLTFDGGQDLVFFDTTIQNGKPQAIAQLRRNLMASHLNAAVTVGDAMPDPNFVRLADGNQAFEVFRELLESGGAGLIEPLWNGQVPGAAVIDPSSFPPDDVADPDGRNFETLAGVLLAALAAATPPAWP